MPHLIDTHIHLDAPELGGDGFGLVAPALEQGIAGFVVPGVRVAGWQLLLEQIERQPQVYASPGLHPVCAEQWTPEVGQQLASLSRHPRVVAIGEIGLDGGKGANLGLQELVFRAQLEIALDAGLPVLLHARKATGQTLEILREMNIGDEVGGVWHGFSGSLQVADELVELGFKIGVGPILLRASARRLPEAASKLPLSALVLETDLPDMAESPEVLITVAERVAELRGCSFSEVAAATSANARTLFGI